MRFRAFRNDWLESEKEGEKKCRNHFCLLVCAVENLGFIIFVILVSFVPKEEDGSCRRNLC